MNVMQRHIFNGIRPGVQEIFLVVSDQEKRQKNCFCNQRDVPLVSTFLPPMVFVLLNFVHEDSHLSVFNSVFKMISHLQWNFFGAIFFDYDGLFPGWMKFYFLEPCPPTREFPGEYSMVTMEYSLENIQWLRRSIPWLNKILFSKGTPPRENSLENIP